MSRKKKDKNDELSDWQLRTWHVQQGNLVKFNKDGTHKIIAQILKRTCCICNKLNVIWFDEKHHFCISCLTRFADRLRKHFRNSPKILET